ncbi:SusC/RagA family TonB-linked outer membrane protein [Pedobacter sp. MC2016-14]|uniref:SusC/RagA family TonB-linked outer membrane protein n=1 Tax=Pedobacter sp. MC2016-14 TaxID=2897327 RepID=UPI001E2850F5|nr:SusC/RagA family TonB-linked outer membrane protein [Pedobacter sp. MC2016-14]MCD0488358.1 SusC/RagA family TonB-linked outer membrane protein [Pedobacter sp. MC2016-14]
MKLTILIMTTFLMQVSAAGLAQNVSFTQKNATLKQLFTEIRKQTGYNVFWQEDKVNDQLKFNASFNNATLEEVLNKTLYPQSLTYTIVNQTVVVKRKDKQFLDRIADYFNSVNINGKILDAETNLPIAKVSVTLKGSTRTVISDERGTFIFNGLPDNAVLVFSSVGYTTREMGASENMVVSLSLATQELENVVVSTGYQTMDKKSATGSFGILTAKDIESTPSVNLMERLEGKVPGVRFDIRNNKIEIRGTSTYSLKYPPLIVIDGFPAINQDLNTVTSGAINGNVNSPTITSTSGNAVLGVYNPNDIESITFLRDAAASAIWGARAASGVIVITTKRGKKGTSSINFSTTLSTSGVGNFKNLTSMNSSDYIDLEQELVDKGFITDPVIAYNSSPLNGFKAAPVSEAQEWMLLAKRSPTTRNIARRDSALSILRNRSGRDQLKDYMLQRAVTQQYNLSFSGGADNSSYYVSGNYTKDQPIYKSNSGETYSVTSNLTNDFLKKRITLNTGLNYTYSSAQVNPAALQALSVGSYGLAPYELLKDANGNNIYKGVTFTTRVSDSLTRVNKLMPWTYNAIDELNYNNTITSKNSIRINTSLKGQITSWLSATVSGQIQKNIQDQVNNQNQNSYLTRDLYNNSYNTANLTNTSYLRLIAVPKGGVYKSSKLTADEYALRGQLDVKKDFGTDHHFEMVAGTEIRQTKATGSEQTLYGYNEDLSSSTNVTPTIFYSTITGVSGRLNTPSTVYKARQRNLSYYTVGSYSYKNKYYISGSARFDDLNIIGVDRRDRARPLWSTGLRWDIKKENFLENVNWINALSFRGSVGTAGNPPQTSNNYTRISTGAVDSYTQLPYATISTPANQDIGWETTKITNGGIDASFLAGRLNLTFDAYSKRTTDVLMNLPLNAAYGFTSLQINAGTLAGHGVDFGLSGDIIRSKDWNWNAVFNFAYNTNKLTDARFQPSAASIGNVLTTDYPVDNIFVYRWAGLSNTGQSQIFTASGAILNSSGFPTIKAEDRVYAGRTTAPYFGGFLNAVKYKNITLSARATYNLGHKFLIKNINSSNYPNNSGSQGLLATSQALINRWKKAGDEAITDVPGLTGTSFNSVSWYQNSDINVRDAGNIRLQQVSLTYSVPQYLLTKTPFIKGINIGATVSNLGSLWVANKEGIDPEYQMTETFVNLPPTRNYVLNVSISL